jgi:hypothetical protein
MFAAGRNMLHQNFSPAHAFRLFRLQSIALRTWPSCFRFWADDEQTGSNPIWRCFITTSLPHRGENRYPVGFLLKLYVPSRHCAVAPCGGPEQFSGRGTVCPLLFTCPIAGTVRLRLIELS